MNKCESPMEEEFLYSLRRWLPIYVGGRRGCLMSAFDAANDDSSKLNPISIEQQVSVLNYRLDFKVGMTGFEIDGKEFHNAPDDRIRDSKILETGIVDQIIRIPASAFWWHENAVQSICSQWCGDLRDYVRTVDIVGCNIQFDDFDENCGINNSCVYYTSDSSAHVGPRSAFTNTPKAGKEGWTGVVTRMFNGHPFQRHTLT